MDTTPAGSIGATPPQPRAVVVPDRDGILHVDHLTAPPVQPIAAPEPAYISPAPIVPAAPAAPIVPISPVVEVDPPAPIANPMAMSTPPLFSPVTPVYAPTPTNSAADIVQPAVKGLEFVSSPTPTVLPPPVQTIAPAPVIPTPPVVTGPINSIDGVIGGPAPSVSTPPIQQTGAIDMPPPIPTPNTGVSQLEQTVQDIDIDQMIDNMPNLTEAIETPAPVVPVTPIQPPVSQTLPPLSQSISQPPTPPTPVNANPVASYFQSLSPGAAAMPSTIASGADNGFAKFKKPLIIAGIAVLVLATGIYAIAAVVTNNNAKQVVQPTTTAPDTNTDTAPTPPTTTATDDTDTTTTPPVTPQPEAPAVTPPVTPTTPAPTVTPTPTVVPTAANTAAYDGNVSEQPQSITINKLGIRAASIENVGITTSGAMGSPSNIWNAGWYTGSALPGTNGAVFIDGHASSNRNGLFGNLDKLQIGDRIGIERNDGRTVMYKVMEIKTVDRNAVDMVSMLRPYGDASRGLNIMSCSGAWIESEQTLQNRVLVYAVEV